MEVVTLDIINAMINSLKYSDKARLQFVKQRVVLSYLIAIELNEEIAYQVFMASLLKEIGEIGYHSKAVEDKETCNYYSAEIIRVMPEIIPFQYDIADIILESSERLDGTGLPASKKNILFSAQIIGCSEVYLKLGEFIEEAFEDKFNSKIIKKLKYIISDPEKIEILNKKEKLEKTFDVGLAKYNVYKEEINGVEEEQFLTSVASLIDAKHSYTAGHTKRVASYSYSIAKELGYDEKQLTEIRYASYLHDIGKIAMDTSLLDKPGKLTDEEYTEIKKHAYYSFHILEDSPGLKRFSFGALHHERLDGKGYPFELTAKDIPEGARIISIADILDALTSNRPYRRPFTFKEAFNLMGMMVGSALDPNVFEVAKHVFNI